ncbi:MAG: uncharacterized protein JWP68_1100 [Modestobacter sp.]|jgi:hypothetical protein|nr:uncharacterized protein [Modestobacter sp.]
MPEPHLRASDADRAAVADVLGTHMSTGRLTVAEYDDRLARAYAARTYGDLAPLTADLPTTDPPRVAQPSPTPAPAAGYTGCGGAGWARSWTGWGPWAGGSGRRAAWRSWMTTAVIVVGIWALTSIGSADWIYPWPLWVVGPWGIVLLAQSLGGDSGRDRGRNPDRHATAPRDR